MEVRLLRAFRHWVEGQEIGIDDEVGQAWIGAGVAERIGGETAPPPDPPDPPAEGEASTTPMARSKRSRRKAKLEG